MFKAVASHSGIWRSESSILNPLQNACYQNMTGGNLEAFSVQRGFVCTLLTPASKIDVYQLMLCQINGAISQRLPWNCPFPVISQTRSLLPSPRSLSFPVSTKILLAFLPAKQRGHDACCPDLLAFPLLQSPIHWAGCPLQWPCSSCLSELSVQEHWKVVSSVWQCEDTLFMI